VIRDLRQQDPDVSFRRLIPAGIADPVVSSRRPQTIDVIVRGCLSRFEISGAEPADVCMSVPVSRTIRRGEVDLFSHRGLLRKLGLQVTVEELQNPDVRPDRLLTELIDPQLSL
jgi:hypothetical protein